MSALPPAELNLIGQNELVTLDRWALERRSRALAQALYLGEGVMLCRALGRYKIYVASDDVGFGAHLMLDGAWETWLTVFMARRLQPGMRVVDVGANHGYYTVMFADLVGPTGRVAAIEPGPRTASLLRRTVAVNGFDDRVTVHEVAAMDVDDTTLTFSSPVHEPKNARVLGEDDATATGTITVRGARLDTLLRDWPKIDFIKADVEGAEEAMMAGAWPLLTRDRPRLLLEFNAGRCRNAGGLLDRLVLLYGPLRAVSVDSRAEPVSRATLLSGDRQDDWLLWCGGD
ncbi:MAG: FkbM family methyltransferase [Brevundimonas sp.]